MAENARFNTQTINVLRLLNHQKNMLWRCEHKVLRIFKWQKMAENARFNTLTINVLRLLNHQKNMLWLCEHNYRRNFKWPYAAQPSKDAHKPRIEMYMRKIK